MANIPTIQFLRALAALMVLFGHVIAEAEHYYGMAFGLDFIPWSRGVDIFFVISGFIITISAHHLFGQLGAAKAFLWRRFVRVAPLYYFFTTLMVAALLFLPGMAKDTAFDPGQIISSFLFLPYERYDGRIAPVLSLGWTLNFEMFFYAIFAVFLAARGRIGPIGVIITIVGLSLIGIFSPPDGAIFKVWTNPIMITFVFGILIARAYLQGITNLGGGIWVLALGVVLLILLSWLVVNGVALPRFIASGLPSALIVAACVLFKSSEVRIPKLWLLLGDASYALYLSHRFVLRVVTVVVVPLLPNAPVWGVVYIVATIGLAILAGIATHMWIEKPMARVARPRRKLPKLVTS